MEAGTGRKDGPDSKSLRVLHLKASLDRQMGGSVTALVSIAAATSAGGDCATVLTLHGPSDDISMLHRLSEDVGQELLVVRRRLPYGFSLRMLWWLWRNTRRFDIVEAHEVFAFPTVAAAAVCRFRSVPFVLHPHNSLDPYDLAKHARLKRLLRPLIRQVLAASVGIWLTTRAEADRLDDHGVSVNRVVSPLPVDRLNFAADPVGFRRRLGIPSEAFVLLFLGRIDRKKGIPRTVRAFDRLDDHVHLVIAGSGSDREIVSEINEQIDRSTARARIHRVGYLVDGEVADAFAAADLFILHSDNENFGLAPVEAAMQRLPSVLSSDVMVAQELVELGAAVVVPTHDEEHLCATLRELATRGPAFDRILRGAASARLPFQQKVVAETDAKIRRNLLSEELKPRTLGKGRNVR